MANALFAFSILLAIGLVLARVDHLEKQLSKFAEAQHKVNLQHADCACVKLRKGQ